MLKMSHDSQSAVDLYVIAPFFVLVMYFSLFLVRPAVRRNKKQETKKRTELCLDNTLCQDKGKKEWLS